MVSLIGLYCGLTTSATAIATNPVPSAPIALHRGQAHRRRMTVDIRPPHPLWTVRTLDRYSSAGVIPEKQSAGTPEACPLHQTQYSHAAGATRLRAPGRAARFAGPDA